MAKLILNRNFVLTSTKGHSIAFKKGELTHVPDSMYAEALAIGAQPPEGEGVVSVAEEPARKAPMDPSERNPLILAAIEKIISVNDRKDFTAAGTPTVKAVERETGFNVDTREVAAVMQARNEEKGAQ